MSVVKAKIIQEVIKAKVSPPAICSPSQIQINGANFAEAASGSTLNIPVVNQDDNPVGVIAGDKVVVSESPRTYNYGYFPGQKDTFAVGDDGWMLENYWKPLIASGDVILDGKINPIDPEDFTKVVFDNVFGNKERFTDDNGIKSVNADGYTIDHHTGLMTVTNFFADNSWATALANGTGTDFGGTNNHLGFTDWMVSNIKQQLILFDYNISNSQNYQPFDVSFGTQIHSSTTAKSNDSFSVCGQPGANSSIRVSKVNSRPYFINRKAL